MRSSMPSRSSRDCANEPMLEKYGGGASKKWYLKIDNHHYDQKLIIRAAHVHQGLGELAPARRA